MRTLPGSRRRGDSDGQPPGSPLWMTTYGDLMTQILIFFALLFALSSVDIKKFDMYISSLQGSLGIIQGGQTLEKGEFIESGEVGQFLVSAEEQRQFERLEEDVRDIINKNNLKGVQVELDERGLVIRFVEGVLFDSGKADLKKQARAVLDKIAPILKQSKRQIRVEGHTDNVPIHTRQFPSNWELSTARAVNVVRYFIEKHNLSPYTISAAGYGEYRPVAPNDTDKHRALNRRVDIVILKSISEHEEPE